MSRDTRLPLASVGVAFSAITGRGDVQDVDLLLREHVYPYCRVARHRRMPAEEEGSAILRRARSHADGRILPRYIRCGFIYRRVANDREVDGNGIF